VFVDVDPATFNLDGDRLAAVLEARPDVRAAIVTHTFGVGAPMADLSDACRRRGVALVEDCAHAFRPFPAGQPRGTAAFFSLGNSKQVNALGGGLAATDDPDLLAGAAARLRHGGDGPGPLAAALAKQGAYSAVTFPAFFAVAVRPLALLAACTGRDLERRGVDAAAPVLDTAPAALHPFKAALARRQIPAAGALNERRVRLATLLDGELDPAIDRQQVPASVPPLLMFTILAPDREALAARLLWRGIDTKRDFLADCSALFDRRPMEVASRVSRRALHLPFHPDLTDDQVRRVARAVNGAWSRQ
jgi:dTDP-4-amino-4,6-dideoxygalactose transaminase